MATIHHSSTHRRAAQALRAKHLQPCQSWTGCIYPGDPIRYDLRAPHPLSFSAEHWPPIELAGPHNNLVPSHLGCQHNQGGMIRAGKAQQVAPPSSGVWD